ncbi:unnamed protein product [Ectocarpus sp. CCAP 1310/34]|nr:unnamed protein product [Ectocarpus sp. CCAP 1310/34]
MWEPGPFPNAAMKRVQRLEGNSACMDCGAPETSWGGPTYGILLCVKCASRHRSLGTHLTVIKSLAMDRWDAGQVRRMELGGNGQLHAWFTKCQTENSALEMKYRTKAATLYREKLRVAADEDLASGGGQAAGELQGARGSRKGRIFAAAERAAASSLAQEEAEAEAAAKKLRKRGKGSRVRRREAERGGALSSAARLPVAAGHDPPSAHAGAGAAPGGAAAAATVGTGMEEYARRCGREDEYEVVFGPGGMGFTLMKDAVSRALVTRLAPGGMAFRLGVRTGDYLVGVDGRRLHDYDQLMLLLPRAPRPLRLLFEGAGAALAASPPAAPGFASASTAGGKLGANGGSHAGGGGNSSDASSGGGGGGGDTESATHEGGRYGGDEEKVAVVDAAVPLRRKDSPSKRETTPAENEQRRAKDTAGGGRPVTNGHSTASNGHDATAAAASTGTVAGVGAQDGEATASAPDQLDGDGSECPPPPAAAEEGGVRNGEEPPCPVVGVAIPEAVARYRTQEDKPREKESVVVSEEGQLSDNAGNGATAAAAAVVEQGDVGGVATVEEVAVEARAKQESRETHTAVNSSSSPSAAVGGEEAERTRESVAPNGGGGGGGRDSAAAVVSSSDRKKKRKKGGKSLQKEDRGVSSGGKAEPGLGEGSKVTVQDKKKSSKWRKGLLCRRHGDGSWTVRYSGGMEERRVAVDRMRLRVPEITSPPPAPAAAAAAAAVSTHVTAVTGTTGERMEGRRRSRKAKKGKEEQFSPAAAAGAWTCGGSEERRHHKGGGGENAAVRGSGRTGWEAAASAPGAWVAADTTQDRHEDFRAPGELRDDFFADNDGSGSSGSSSGGEEEAVSVLAGYSGQDPGAADPPAFAAPAYAAGAYAAPRRMEGFGGGRGWRGRGEVASGGGGSVGKAAQQPAQSRGHTVVFPAGTMGLTLTKEMSGGCSVTKVVPGGLADSRGVALGQRVCAVNGQPSGTYEHTMAVIGGSPRPISITFVTPTTGGGSGKGGRFSGVGGGPPIVQHTWADVGLAATIGAMDAANAVAVEWGLGASTPGVLDGAHSSGAGDIPPAPQGFRVHQKHSLMAIPTGVAGGFGNSLAKHRTFAVDVSPDMATMSTKKALSDAPGEEVGEFDVRFGEGELGMRLEERGSFKASSVVVKITEGGQAVSLGVREGCKVVGINGEKYLSHAHTVATLKHAKRPVVVRFRLPDASGRR